MPSNNHHLVPFTFYLYINFLLLISFGTCAYICQHDQIACGAEIRSYPLLDVDGSGWGSGMDTPLYDEFFQPLQTFDFSAPSNLTSNHICDCQGDKTCLADINNVIKLDQMITLIFCNNVDEIFRYFSLVFFRCLNIKFEYSDALYDKLMSNQ